MHLIHWYDCIVVVSIAETVNLRVCSGAMVLYSGQAIGFWYEL